MSENNMADMLKSLLSGLNGGNADETFNGEENTSSGFDFGSMFENIDFDMLMKVGELFAKMNQPDKNAELLKALKPIMREENRDKIDTALKLLKLTALLPFLRESGFMDKIF